MTHPLASSFAPSYPVKPALSKALPLKTPPGDRREPSHLEKLKVVRKYTGDNFTASKGYDARKPLSRGRKSTITKYYNKIMELTSVATQVYRPKPKEKREAFNYTGQTGYNKFAVAIVRKDEPSQNFRFEIDQTKPKGTRFTAIDRQTGRRYYHLPAHLFNHETLDASEYAAVIEDYTPDAEFYLIQAGESYMGGAGGDAESIGEKLVELFRNYSSTQFDANDKNSHYFGNWFRGVRPFTSRFDAFPLINKYYDSRDKFRKTTGITKRYRRLLGYGAGGRRLVGEFENGTLVQTHELSQRRDGNRLLSPGEEGMLAFNEGMRLADNPYSPSVEAFKFWRSGWLLARKQST